MERNTDKTKHVVCQDDCSPDSMESFCEEFKTITGMSLTEFKKIAFMATLQMGFKWKHRNFLLEWYCDDPFYRLTVSDTKNVDKTNDVRSKMLDVVKCINERKNSTDYFGGTNTRDAEVIAAKYALEAAKDEGHITDAYIRAHLEFIKESGAEFDFDAALKYAFSERYWWVLFSQWYP